MKIFNKAALIVSILYVLGILFFVADVFLQFIPLGSYYYPLFSSFADTFFSLMYYVGPVAIIYLIIFRIIKHRAILSNQNILNTNRKSVNKLDNRFLIGAGLVVLGVVSTFVGTIICMGAATGLCVNETFSFLSVFIVAMIFAVGASFLVLSLFHFIAKKFKKN